MGCSCIKFFSTKTEITQVKKILRLDWQNCYVAPESLTKEENVNFLKNVTISFVAIDEAHCILNGAMILDQNIEI
jgi:superfamily II DNA helicase RecQ